MAKSSFSFRRGSSGEAEEQPAFGYGVRGEELPDVYLYSTLTRLDTEAAQTLGRARARLDALQREITTLAGRLAAPLEDVESSPRAKDKRRGNK